MPYDPAKDPFNSHGASKTASAADWVPITPSDSTDLALYVRALRIHVPTGTSNPQVTYLPSRNADGVTRTLKLAEGVNLELAECRRVLATGTTAGLDIHGAAG